MNMNEFFQRLDQLFAQKEMAQAEKYMKESLAAAEAEGDFGAVISICSELGGYCRVTSQYQDGIALYEKALSCIQRLGLDGAEHHGTTLMNYATTYTMTGDTEKALSLYGQAAEIFRKAGFETDYRLATLHNNMSLLCQDLGQYDQAVDNLNQAMSILQQLTESEIEQAITYSNLAQVYMLLDRLGEAKEAVEKAIALFTASSGDRDVHYAAAVNVLGEIYYKEGNIPEAAELFEKALALTSRDFGEANFSYAVLCENLSKCCEKSGDTEKAEAYRKRSADIRERISL